MTLGEYLERKQIEPAAAAAALGVSLRTMQAWLQDGGSRRPHWPHLERIAAWTGRAVMPNDFLNGNFNRRASET